MNRFKPNPAAKPCPQSTPGSRAALRVRQLAILLSLAAGPTASAQVFSSSATYQLEVTPPLSERVFGRDFSSWTTGTVAHVSDSLTFSSVTAVGSASGSASVSTIPSWNPISATSTASHSYPATPPNSEAGNPFGYGARAFLQADSSITVTDLIFSGPTSSTTASLNANLSRFRVTANANTANQQVSGYAYFSASMNQPTLDDRRYMGSMAALGDGSDSSFGLLSGIVNGAASVVTGSWTVPVGTPVVMNLSLGAWANSAGGYGTSGSATASAAFLLPTSGPVFNLPEGYTVNSALLGIVDNQWIPVPEPEEYAACGAALLIGFASLRRRARA
jgi:hypothetical protein